MKKNKSPDCLSPFDPEFLSLPLIYREGRTFNFMSESVSQGSTNGASILSPHSKQEAPLLTKHNLNGPCCVHNAGEYWSQRSQKPWALGQRLDERQSQNTVLQSTLDRGEALNRNHWWELSLTTALWAHLEEVTGLEWNGWPTAWGKNSVGTWGTVRLKLQSSEKNTKLEGASGTPWICIQNIRNRLQSPIPRNSGSVGWQCALTFAFPNRLGVCWGGWSRDYSLRSTGLMDPQCFRINPLATWLMISRRKAEQALNILRVLVCWAIDLVLFTKYVLSWECDLPLS